MVFELIIYFAGITQPRRVAASSTAIRVAEEMGCPINSSEDITNNEQDEQKSSKKRKRKNLNR